MATNSVPLCAISSKKAAWPIFHPGVNSSSEPSPAPCFPVGDCRRTTTISTHKGPGRPGLTCTIQYFFWLAGRPESCSLLLRTLPTEFCPDNVILSKATAHDIFNHHRDFSRRRCREESHPLLRLMPTSARSGCFSQHAERSRSMLSAVEALFVQGTSFDFAQDARSSSGC